MDDGRLVACAGLERDGSDLVLRAVAVVPERRGSGVGRALIDALAGAATAERLVVQDDAVPVFFRACGFVPGTAGARSRLARPPTR